MYAIIETGGKQYRVSPGTKFRVERLDGEIGADVRLENVLLVSQNGQTVIGTPRVEDFEVSARIVDQGRGDKVRVIKMKRRKNYRRTQGHRQRYTELLITGFGEIAPESGAETARQEPAAAEAEVERGEAAKESPAAAKPKKKPAAAKKATKSSAAEKAPKKEKAATKTSATAKPKKKPAAAKKAMKSSAAAKAPKKEKAATKTSAAAGPKKKSAATAKKKKPAVAKKAGAGKSADAKK